jgi:putative transposase
VKPSRLGGIAPRSKLAEQRPRFGWRRLQVLLRENLKPNHKRLRRIYREERLQVRPQKKRRARYIRGNTASTVSQINQEWGLDFMEDRLFYGRKIRALTLEDRFLAKGSRSRLRSRSPPDALSANSTPSPRFADTQSGCESTTGRSERSASELVRRAWSQLHFIEPGKPAQNAWIESLV